MEIEWLLEFQHISPLQKCQIYHSQAVILFGVCEEESIHLNFPLSTRQETGSSLLRPQSLENKLISFAGGLTQIGICALQGVILTALQGRIYQCDSGNVFRLKSRFFAQSPWKLILIADTTTRLILPVSTHRNFLVF